MTSEIVPLSPDDARPVLPLAEAAAAGSERFSQARMERIIGLVVGFGCSVLGIQAFLNAITSTQETAVWRAVLILAVFVPLGFMVVSAVTGIGTRSSARVFALVFPVVLLVWPLATWGRGPEGLAEPWVWFLLNVATVAAVLAFELPLQVVWAVTVPVLYGVARVIQVGWDELAGTVLDVIFAVILALVIVVLGRVLRALALNMDNARRDAVGSYAQAAAADAAEQERVAVAALMHDSVLAALIAAERARTPRERTLAVSMAREGLTRLANVDQDAGEGSDAPVTVAEFRRELNSVSEDAGGPDVLAAIGDDEWRLPGRVARALALATAQAVANAVEHADGVGLVVELTAAEGSIEIVIQDRGHGFDPDDVPTDRLGIRGSISARVAAVAGHSRIDSGADGTRVTLRWEQPE